MKTSYAIRGLLLFLLTLGLVACQPSGQQTETGEEATGGAGGAGGKKTRTAAATHTVTVPAGTTLAVRLTDAINTGTTAQGATFSGTLAEPLVVEGMEVAPVGSAVSGSVTHVVSSGRLSRPAELSLVLTTLKPTGGNDLSISTSAWSMKGESHKKRNIGMIGGGGGAGAIVGAIAGGKKGAAIGGAVGAGAGTGVAAATGKKEITLAPETKLNFTLNAPLTLTMRH